MFLNLCKKRILWEIVAACLLICIGIFLRTYNFSDWLHFEIDQSYDTLIVSRAIENGPGELPLLGPTAGGGRALRLGPAFYYIEYASALLFGNTPQGHAAIVLIFSILSLPLFYLFCKIYFSKEISLSLLLLYSLSLYAIIYSRFSWSPNVLPFLTILFFITFLKSLSYKQNSPDIWFIASVAVLSIITQIHFNAFFIIPAVAGALLVIRRPRFRWNTWVATFAIALFFYIPVIASDIRNNGENIHFFLNKFSSSSTNKSDDTVKKIVQVINYDASEYFLIITGSDHVNGKKLSGFGLQQTNQTQWRVIALSLLTLELFLLMQALRAEQDPDKRLFLWAIGLWFTLSSFYFFSIRYDGLNIYPRFFLTVLPIPFILFGIAMQKILSFNRVGTFIVGVTLLIPVLSNTHQLITYFSQLSQVATQPITVQTEDVFPNTARITLAQQYAIIDYIEAQSKQNNSPIYIKSKHEYESVLWLHLEKRGFLYTSQIPQDTLYQEGNYFDVHFSNTKNLTDPRFDIAEERNFGTLSVQKLTLKPDIPSIPHQDTSMFPVSLEKRQINQMFTWKKLFNNTKETSSDVLTETKLEETAAQEITEDAKTSGLSDEETHDLINNGTDGL